MIETLQLQQKTSTTIIHRITEKWVFRPFLLLFFLWFSMPLNAQTPTCCPDFELKDLVEICPPKGACTDEHSDQGHHDILAACKESIHTYTVYPNEAIYTYEWTVVGGTPASFTGNPLEIEWGSGTTGYITVVITGANGCEEVITREVCLVDSPTANFSFQPDPVCVNTPVNFTNLSIGGAVYFWEFGDGNTSTLFNPIHSYDQPGQYEVTLTVTDVAGGQEGEADRACGCSDSITFIIEVLEGEGPVIESDCCDGTVCPGEISTFFTNTDCTNFIWTVTGGTIISGQGTSMIEVEWDATYSVPTTVSLETPNCNNAPCPGITTIDVPVLYPNLPINGPANLCQGNNGTYYLPSLPGTYYDWTVTGGGFTINNYDQNTNAVNITFTTPGTFVIESEYDNPLAGCSGVSSVTVEVKPILRIFGEDEVCEGSTEMYFANGDISNWTVNPSGPAINVVLPFVSEITWDNAGTYLITAEAADPTAFCNASAIYQVEVFAPPQLDPIDGPTTVCPDTYLTYFISSDTEGSSFVWSIEPAGSGTIFSEMGVDKDSVVVAFHGPGPWTIEVYQEIEVAPGVTCVSDLEILTVESFPPPVIVSQSGNNLVCVDAVEVFTVTSPVPQGVYEWTITPANRGTIVSGQGTDEVEIRWHGPPANATISVSSCGGSDQMAIEIIDPPLIDWIFPDGPTLYCLPDTPNNLTLSTSFDPGFTYQWYLNGSPIPGETGHEYTITSLPPVPQAYLYEVIASNGVCSKTRERMVLVSDCDGDPPPPIQCALDFTFNPDPACVGEPVSFNATSTPSNFDFAWEFGDNSTSFTQNTQKAFNAPGIYEVTLTGTWFDECSLVVVKQVEVNPLPTCDIIATDTIFCPGDSLMLEASCHGMAAYQWYRQGDLIQGATQPTYWVTTHGEYTLEVTNQFGCSSMSDGVFIFTHGIPRAKITGDQSVCVNAGWFFGMTLSTPYDPDYSYEWSSSLPGVTFNPNNGNNAASTNAFFQFPDPLPPQIEFYVTVTDLTTGCINSDTLCVTVNQIPQVTIPWETDCEGTELTLTPSPIDTSQYHYLWSNGETTPEITVSSAGFYSLLVTDKITGCAANFSAAYLFPKPDLSLFPTGCETLMVNEVLDLYVPLPLNSSSWANTYPQAYPTIEWYDTDNNLLGTGQSFQFSSSTPGYFEVYVVVENNFGCSETSVVFCITVEGDAVDPDPGISVTKTLDNINGTDQTAFTQVGDVLTFTIVVTNTGNVPLTNVVVDDPITGDSWTIPILQPGDSMTFTTTYTITQGDLDSCTIRNIVIATGDDPDGNQVDDMDVISVPCDSQDPDISVTKTLADINGTDMTEFTQVGDVLTYTIEVCNTGNVTLFNVVVDDPLTGFNQVITQLDPGDCQSFSTSYTVTQDDLDAGFVLNTVTATGEDSNDNTVSDEDDETVTGTGDPDISVTKTLANINGTDMTEFTQVGDVLTYTIEVCNTGNVTLFNVVVDDPLTGFNQVITQLDPGDCQSFSTSYTVTQDDLDAGFVLNTVTATGEDSGGNTVSDEDEETVSAGDMPDISVTKVLADINGTGATEYKEVGDVLTYTIEVCNTGNVTLFNVVVNDPLTGLNQTIPQLNPGDCVQFSTSYVITQADLDNTYVLNTVTAVGEDANGNVVEDDDFEVVISCPEEVLPDITLTKTLSDINGTDQTHFTQAGDVLNYTIEVCNTGDLTLFNIFVSDPLTGFSQIIPQLDPGDCLTFNTSYTVQYFDLDRCFVLNVVTATGEDQDGNLVTDIDLEFVECEEVDQLWDFGDAPDGALAYLFPQVVGQFPTCVSDDGNFIRHGGNHEMYFGPSVDYESGGNAGFCPDFTPDLYDQDECFMDGDAGLLFPRVFTIVGDTGSKSYAECLITDIPNTLYECMMASWGSEIDIQVTNNGNNVAYVNVLMDWNRNGQWGGGVNCPDGTFAPEHVLVNFEVPAGYTGPLSGVTPAPADFLVAPNYGYVWVRFSITETPVPANWNGSGTFNFGETEDYLLFVNRVVPDPNLYDFGDAPEGAIAYPPSTVGSFPTCMNTGPAGSFVRHAGNSELFFGPSVDYEAEGNAGWCPTFAPNLYDQDECQWDGDAGLIRPSAYTIFENANGVKEITVCGDELPIHWRTCRRVHWGPHVDIEVTNNLPGGATAYVNVLIDWNQDGQWGGSSNCPFGPSTPEHVLVNFEVPNGYNGPLSALSPPWFRAGPNHGYIWSRFTVSDTPVPANWDGTGDFGFGETEDYLLRVRRTFIIVDNWHVWDVSVAAAVDTCFAATNTVTLGGEGPFVVEDGGSAEITAGRNIRMLAGTKVEAGGYMLARIVTDEDDYCFEEDFLDNTSEVGKPIELTFDDITEAPAAGFNIFPNPTTGKLTLELQEFTETVSEVKIEIVGLMGERIFSAIKPAMRQYELDLSGQPRGIYFIRVSYGSYSETKRVIRQ